MKAALGLDGSNNRWYTQQEERIAQVEIELLKEITDDNLEAEIDCVRREKKLGLGDPITLTTSMDAGDRD